MNPTSHRPDGADRPEGAERPVSPDDRATLAQALVALRHDLAAQPSAPPSVLAAAQRAARQAARQAVRATAPAGLPAGTAWLAWGAPRVWGAWAGAATCAAVLGVSLLLTLRPPAPMVSVPQTTAASGAAAVLSPTGAADVQAEPTPAMHFVPLVSPERMRALAGQGANGALAGADTPAWVVTTELPQQRLAAMGLPYDPGHAAEPLRAELLVAGSGEVLAVRLLF